MIKTATGFIHPLDLEKVLQHQLDSQGHSEVSSKISCIVKDNNLMVLVQYPEPVMPYPRQVFHFLRQCIFNLKISPHYQILMYLIVYGQDRTEIPFVNLNLSNKDTQPTQQIPKIALRVDEKPLLQSTKFTLSGQVFTKSKFKFLNQLRKNWQNNYQLKNNLIDGASTSIAMLTLLILMYLLTRPCVTQRCQVIPEAKQLAQSISNIFEPSRNKQDLEMAKQQLAESLKMLQTIPPWSIYHTEAEKLFFEHKLTLESLEKIITASSNAEKAVSIAKHPPLTLAQWQEIELLWQQAISTLKQIPPNNQAYQLAIDKIQEYQNNLTTVSEQLQKEQKALSSFKAALEAAKLGEVRASVAQSLSNWQLVEATWQTAINRLQEIPNNTSVYAEAQQLLNSYSLKIKQVQFALNQYNQALKQAELAEKSEATQQWSAAIAQWAEAIILLKKVPKDSFQYSQAQVLLADYSKALELSQLKQQAALELEKVCQATVPICNFSFLKNTVKVQLTPSYIQEVWETAIQAKAQDNKKTEVELLAHISSLEQILQAISNNLGLPIEVYNSQQVLLVTYKPN